MIQILLKLFMFASTVRNIEHHKTEMLAAGIWKATKGTANQKEIGYYLNSLYSPVGWMSWETCYRNYLAAEKDDQLLKAWTNTTLGLPWEEKRQGSRSGSFI